jgi:hypothetical protein
MIAHNNRSGITDAIKLLRERLADWIGFRDYHANDWKNYNRIHNDLARANEGLATIKRNERSESDRRFFADLHWLSTVEMNRLFILRSQVRELLGTRDKLKEAGDCVSMFAHRHKIDCGVLVRVPDGIAPEELKVVEFVLRKVETACRAKSSQQPLAEQYKAQAHTLQSLAPSVSVAAYAFDTMAPNAVEIDREEKGVSWSKPSGVAGWATAFRVNRNTMAKMLNKGKLRVRKVSRNCYQIANEDLPADYKSVTHGTG